MNILTRPTSIHSNDERKNRSIELDRNKSFVVQDIKLELEFKSNGNVDAPSPINAK